MTRLPVVSGKEAVRALERVGYQVVRQRGSNIRMKKRGDPSAKPLTVPDHKEIKPGLLGRLIHDAGLTVEQFRKLLR